MEFAKWLLLPFVFISLLSCRQVEEAMPQASVDYRIFRYLVKYDGGVIVPQFAIRFNLKWSDEIENDIGEIEEANNTPVGGLGEFLNALKLWAYPIPWTGHRHIVNCTLLNKEEKKVECVLDIPERILENLDVYPVEIRGKQEIQRGNNVDFFRIVFPRLDLLSAVQIPPPFRRQ